MEPGLKPSIPEAQPFVHGEGVKASDGSIVPNLRESFKGTYLGLCLCAGVTIL